MHRKLLGQGTRNSTLGNEVIEQTRRTVRGREFGTEMHGSRIIMSPKPDRPEFDIFVGMIPKSVVGADFFDVTPHHDRLLVTVGDAPGGGLKGAFIAKFVKTLFRLTNHGR